jgi:hypothetical protein
MNGQERGDILAAVQQRYAVVAPYLTEQSRRMWAAAEAEVIGRHGNTSWRRLRVYPVPPLSRPTEK